MSNSLVSVFCFSLLKVQKLLPVSYWCWTTLEGGLGLWDVPERVVFIFIIYSCWSVLLSKADTPAVPQVHSNAESKVKNIKSVSLG